MPDPKQVAEERAAEAIIAYLGAVYEKQGNHAHPGDKAAKDVQDWIHEAALSEAERQVAGAFRAACHHIPILGVDSPQGDTEIHCACGWTPARGLDWQAHILALTPAPAAAAQRVEEDALIRAALEVASKVACEGVMDKDDDRLLSEAIAGIELQTVRERVKESR